MSQTSHQPKLSTDLQRKASLLKSSALFVHPSDGAEMHEKQQIFLVLAGCKPVANVLSGHWVATPTGRKTVADDPVLVGQFLSLLGLKFSLSDHGHHATGALIALAQEALDSHARASGHVAVGASYGYPETAAQAFAAGPDELLSSDEQDAIEDEAGLQGMTVSFRLSKRHWREELETLKQWYGVLVLAGLVG